MEMAEAVGLALRKIRTQRGVSQEELAHRADLDRTYVSGIERGRRNPTVESLVSIAEALGLRLSRLITVAEQIQRGRLTVAATTRVTRRHIASR
jgi:transcriptional regulator with XRE-family HTH domain